MPPNDIWTIGKLTQGFGPTSEKLDSGYTIDGQTFAHFNKGIDLAADPGTNVTANVSGEIVHIQMDGDPAAKQNGWGTSIWIKDAQGNIHRYSHLSATYPSITKGQQVKAGQVIGLVGSTGASTGPHLSYDVTNKAGDFFDPVKFVQKSNPSITTNYPGTSASTRGTARLPDLLSGSGKPPLSPSPYGGAVRAPYGPGATSALSSGKLFPADLGASKGKVFMGSPSPLGVFSREFAGQDFDTAYDNLTERYFDLADQLAALGIGPNGEGLDFVEDEDTFEQARTLLAALATVEGAMDRLEKSRDQGLLVSGVDAAKTYLETEQGKRGESESAYQDYSRRISDLAALGRYGAEAAQNALGQFNDAQAFNAELWRGQEQGTISPLIGPRAPRMRAGGPTIDPTKFAPALEASIPSVAPAYYGVDPGAYDAYNTTVQGKRKIRELIGANRGVGADPRAVSSPYWE